MAGKEGYGNSNSGADFSFYAGADYGLDSNHGELFNDVNAGTGYSFNPSTFAFTTDPRIANQLSAVSGKLNTGAKSIEVSGVSPQVLDAMPKQQFDEIRRLKDLTGTELTFHGPLVEPSGWSDAGWNEVARQGAEEQMFSAIEKGHQMDPKGNIVITFHSNNSLPELDTRVKENGKEISKSTIIFNERDGALQRLIPKENFLLGKTMTPSEELSDVNKELWVKELSQVSFHIEQGENAIQRKVREFNSLVDKDENLKGISAMEIYKLSKTDEGQKEIEAYNPAAKEASRELINTINYGEIYIRESYLELQKQFNKAWVAVNNSGNKEDLEKLEILKDQMQKSVKGKDPLNPDNLSSLTREIQKSVNVLNNLSEAPKTWRPANEFIIDKSAESFANLAIRSYDKFKNSAPVISIENPPAGGALTRGEDLKELVKSSREKFIEGAQTKLGLSKSAAEKQAEKLIGVTWDVGHINMLKKFGYTDKDLAKQTEKVAPYVKHIHLSDNFGFEHTELPMGMGNVPIKEHLKAIGKYNKQIKKLKQVVETGGAWFEHFKTTPIRQTLEAFGSPIYSSGLSPTWNQSSNASGGYFSGYGQMLPQQYFSRMGAGFSELPPELGGNLGGQSRVSGNPIG